MSQHRRCTETQTYTYDALSRLTAAAVTGGPANYSESYTYNATTGNLETKGGLTLAYNDANHAHAVTSAGGNTYGYDLNGNQVTRVIGGSTYTLGYDAENRLVSVSGPSLSAQFTYDGDGRRVKSTINGVTTAFVGNHYEATGGAVTKYYFAAGSRVAMRKNGSLFYLLGDHLGSTSIVTDAGGNKISEMKYRAWGEVRYSSGAQVTNYTFTGQFSNVDDFGLMYYGARWYDPSLMRFVSPDSIVPLATQGTQALDRYADANNNPPRYNDPIGHWIETVLDLAFIAYDVYQINQEGWTLVNTVALVADVACVIVPAGTGGGPAVRAIASGQDIKTAVVAAVKTAETIPDLVRIGQATEKLAQFADSSTS